MSLPVCARPFGRPGTSALHAPRGRAAFAGSHLATHAQRTEWGSQPCSLLGSRLAPRGFVSPSTRVPRPGKGGMAVVRAESESQEEDAWSKIEEGENFQTMRGGEAKLLFSMDSPHNQVKVIQIPGDQETILADCRILLLDDTGNIHSLLKQKGDTSRTASYWDEFSSLPPLIPEGPVGVLGLGAGTALHQWMAFWPDRKVEGWELDPVVLLAAREHLGLDRLEAKGLVAHEGDALGDSVGVEGGFAGLQVDLFSEGQAIPQLTEEENWRKLKSKLMPGGRIMANIGGDGGGGDGDKMAQKVLDAMVAVFGEGQVHRRNLDDDEESLAANIMAITGDAPNPVEWGKQLPPSVMPCTLGWRPAKAGEEVVPNAPPEGAGGFADVE